MPKKLLDGVTGDGAGSTQTRGDDLVRSGLVYYKKTNTGTCTVEIKEAHTDAVVKSFSVAADNPAASIDEIALPNAFYAEVSSASGTFALDVWVDGI